MPIRLINTTKFLEALISVNKDRFAFAQYALEHHPKIAIAYDEWLAGETVRKEEEQRENERKRQEAIENEKRRLEMEKKWAIRVVDVNNKVNASGKKIPIIKFLREGCLGYYGLIVLLDPKQMYHQ